MQSLKDQCREMTAAGETLRKKNATLQQELEAVTQRGAAAEVCAVRAA